MSDVIETGAEAPASVTVRGYYMGYSMLVTMRDQSIDPKILVQQGIRAIDQMIAQMCRPDWKEAETTKVSPTTEEADLNGYAPNPDPHEVPLHTCAKCRSTLVFKKGVSKKTGKLWAGYFCPNATMADKTHTTEWA